MMNRLTVFAQTTGAVKHCVSWGIDSVAQYGSADNSVAVDAAICPKVQDD